MAAGGYSELKAAWARTAQEAGELDATNRALVFNYLASAAQRTASVLRTHANDAASAQDAEAYANGMKQQDVLRKGWSVGKFFGNLIGWGVVGGLLAGGAAGLLSLFGQAGQAGSEYDMRQLLLLFAGNSALLYFIARAVITAGPAVAQGIADTLSEAFSSADPAKLLVSSNLDAPEQAFFSRYSASRPSRLGLNSVGPVFAALVVAVVGIPIALIVFFLYSSLVTTSEQSSSPSLTTPTF